MWEVSGLCPGCPSGYRSSDLGSYDTPVWEVSGSCPGGQSGNRIGVLYSRDPPTFWEKCGGI